MMHSKRIAVWIATGLLGFATPAAGQIGGEPPADPIEKIRWPSADYPTLQSAVDALAPGGLIKISPGVHVLREPVRIEKRRLTIKGKGAKEGKPNFTQLVGPPPRPVADEENQILLPPEDAQALFHSVASDLTIRRLAMTGFDTALLMEDDAAGSSGNVVVSRCSITETGRGLTSLSTGTLTVSDTTISDTVWNGISVAPRITLDSIGPGFRLITYNDKIVNPQGAGIYLSQGFASVNEVLVENAQAGGIVGYKAKAIITNSFLLSNFQAGILLLDSDDFPFVSNIIQGNAIQGSLPLHGLLGDGITLLNSGSELVRNNVSNNARAGLALLGSLGRVKDNHFVCSGAFDVQTDSLDGEQPIYVNEGGNVCGCGSSLGPCPLSSSAPMPPTMVGGLE